MHPLLQKIKRLYFLLQRGGPYLYKCIFENKKIVPMYDVEIDIIIPAIKKDLKILPLTLKGIKENVNHRINNIYILSPNDIDIINFCKINNLIFIDERSILGYGPEDINFITTNGKDRSGWVFQQLLKLAGKIGCKHYYLVIDADHILLKPHTFITIDKKFVFYQSYEWHYPYYKNIKILIGKNAINSLSYVAHKMIFDKELIQSLHKELEKRSNETWDKTIIRSLNPNETSPFSEYELFGTFVSNKNKICLPWREKTLKYEQLDNYYELKMKYKNYRSITFPAHLNNNQQQL